MRMNRDVCAECVKLARCLEKGTRCENLSLNDPWGRFRETRSVRLPVEDEESKLRISRQRTRVF